MYPISYVAAAVAFAVMLVRSLYLTRTHRKLPSIVWVIVAGIVSAALGIANDQVGPGLTHATANNVLAIWVMAAGGWGTLKTMFEHVLGLTAGPDPALPGPQEITATLDPNQIETEMRDLVRQLFEEFGAKLAAGATHGTLPATSTIPATPGQASEAPPPVQGEPGPQQPLAQQVL